MITEDKLFAIGFVKDNELSRPHIVDVYKYGHTDGKTYTAQKLVEDDEWDIHIDDDHMMCIGSFSCKRIETLIKIIEIFYNEFRYGD